MSKMKESYRRVLTRLFILILFLREKIGLITGLPLDVDESGPKLVGNWEKSSFLLSSRVGGKIYCGASGEPQPKIEWISKDLQPLTNITSLRTIDREGTITFNSFEREKFRADLHLGVYLCRATNKYGSVISPPIQLKTVIDFPFEIQNEDVSVLRGNIAILRCLVPQQVSELVSVTSWIQNLQNSSVNIYPNFQTGKYLMMPSGDLYIFSVDSSDNYMTFACRITHRLTNEVKTSSPSRILIRESQRDEPVRLKVPKQMSLRAKIGDNLNLACIASGNPPPSYQWHVERGEKLSDILGSGSSGSFSRTSHSSHVGPIYTLTSVRTQDSGKVFVCQLNNSISHDTLRILLTVHVPLKVQMSPRVTKVEVGRSVSFRCLITGSPVKSVQWFKDAQKLNPLALPPTYSLGKNELSISSVYLEDIGIFQCFASNDDEIVQDSAQLKISSIIPELVYRFSEQTLQPGPFVSLKCIGIGNPPPQFSWTLDGFQIPQNERYMVGQYVTVEDSVISHLNISNTEAVDGGLYSCTAQNSVGAAVHSARLNIYGLPFIRSIPSIKAVSGKTLQINCPVSGYPIQAIKWERGGVALPTNRRQRVFTNGTLIIQHVEKGDDDGIYGCEARNSQGASSSRDLHVQVIVPPKILPFQFMSQLLREGMRASVSCSILEGDRPFEFAWLFNDRPINLNPSSNSPRITFPDEYSSTLIIESLNYAHSGLYSCIAKNSAGKETHVAHLSVNVAPKWVTEPKDINISSGHSVSIHCEAEGEPKPEIHWRKATRTLNEFKEIKEEMVEIYSNGTIRLSEVRKSDEGQYLCEAKNGVGSGLSKVIAIKVNSPPELIDRALQISSKINDKTSIQCRAKGDLPIEFQWSNKHSQITKQSNQRIEIREQELRDEVISELFISETRREDGGAYYCRANNFYGSDQMSILLVVKEPPEQPTLFKLVEKNSRSVRLSWTEPFDGNSPLVNYILQYKFPSDTWTERETTELLVPPLDTTYLLSALSPATTYHFRLVASNSIGYSSPSGSIEINTLEEAPEGTVSNLMVSPLSSTELLVRWSGPERRLWHGNLLGYYLAYKELGEDEGTINSTDGFNYKTIERVGDEFGGEIVLENLNKFKKHVVVVQAFNSQGTGPPSQPAFGTTLTDVPSMSPIEIVCMPHNSESLRLSWEDPPPDERNGVIDGYKIQIGEEDELNSSKTLTSHIKSMTIRDLKKWTNYNVCILAFTSAGDGPCSKPSILCSTDEDYPTAPSMLKALPSSERSILVSWLPPKKPNGRIINYTVYMKLFTQLHGSTSQSHGAKVEKRIVDGSDTSYTFTELKENKNYEFWLSASTKVGEGVSTKKILAKTSNKIGAKIASFSQDISIGWKKEILLPCETVGNPHSFPIWKFNGNQLELQTKKMVIGNGSLKIEELNSLDYGNYTCSVSNPHGNDLIYYNLKVLTPPSIGSVLVKEKFYDAIHLIWTIGNDGGSNIQGYLIHFKRENGEWEELGTNNVTNSFFLKNLQCGSKYKIYVTAFNKIGIGVPSEVLETATKGNSPSMPKYQDLLTIYHSSVVIKFENWTEIGCPIHSFYFEYGESSSLLLNETYKIQVPKEINGYFKAYTINGLKSNSKYYLRISAENNAGQVVVNYDFVTSSISNETQWTVGVLEASNPENLNYSLLTSSLLIVLPSLLSIFAVAGLAYTIIYYRSKDNEPKRNIGESPGVVINSYEDSEVPSVVFEKNKTKLSGGNYYPQNMTTEIRSGTHLENRYQNVHSSKYEEDVCPYATFKLPETAPERPLLNLNRKESGSKNKSHKFHTGDTLYNEGAVYSGPYYSVNSQPPLISLNYNQAPTLQMREDTLKRSRGARSTLQMPLRDYGSRSESESDDEKYYESPHAQMYSQNKKIIEEHEMRTFRNNSQQSGQENTCRMSSSTDSETERKISTLRKKLRKSNKSKSSGYSSYTEEASFSYAPDRIPPPLRFCDKSKIKTDRGKVM